MSRGNPPTREAARNNALARIQTNRRALLFEPCGARPQMHYLRLPRLLAAIGDVSTASIAIDSSDQETLEALANTAAVCLRWMEDLLMEMER